MKRICLVLIYSLYMFTCIAQETTEEVNIETSGEVFGLKIQLRDYILPKQDDSAQIEGVIPNETPIAGPISVLTELGSTEKIVIRLKNNFTSNVYVLHPKISNRLNIPIIYHGGHDGAFWEDRYLNNSGRPYSISVINFFLKRGFEVITIDMPLCGENAGPVFVSENEQNFLIRNHNDLFQLKDPFYYFFEPIKKTLDYLEAQHGYVRYAMVGLSGGGWTTTIYSGTDRRIRQSFSVAGSVPIPFRESPSDVGDMEQHYPEFYDRFNYSTLYTLAAAGRNKLHYQVLNEEDNCCFDFDGNNYWVPVVQNKLASLETPGSFKFYYDPFATMHKISAVAVDSFYKYISNDLLLKNIPFKVKLLNSNPSPHLCKDDILHLSTPLYKGDVIRWYKDNVPLNEEAGDSLLVNTSGTYYAEVQNISGISIYSDTVHIEAVAISTPQISMVNNVLQSSAPNGNYWYYNGKPIPNAKSNWLAPTKPGTYSVIATENHCSSLPSAPYEFGITVFPNPAGREINIRLNPSLGKVTIELYDVSGKIILRDNMIGTKKIVLDNLLHSGIYLLKLKNNTGMQEQRKVIIR